MYFRKQSNYIFEKDAGVSSVAPTISASGFYIKLSKVINQ